MKKSAIYAIVAVVVIIIIVAAAATYVYMAPGGTSPTATPSPEPTALTVVDASTLQFSVAEDTNGAIVNYNFAAKSVNTTTEVLRMDILSDTANYSYIISRADSTSFFSQDNGLTWTASDFAADSTYIVAFDNYQTALVSWDGLSATYTYTTTDTEPPAGRVITISAIHVNPTLDDATYFTHS